MASFRSGIKIVSSAAQRFPYLASNVGARRGNSWQQPVAAAAVVGQGGPAPVEPSSDSNSMNLLVNDPNSSMWQLYRESYGGGGGSVAGEVRRKGSKEAGGKAVVGTRNVQDYYKARWESETGAEEEPATEVQRPLRDARLQVVQRPPVASFAPRRRPAPSQRMEDVDEPLAGSLGVAPAPSLDPAHALWSVPRAPAALPAPEESQPVALEEASASAPDKSPIKSPLLSFKCEPQHHHHHMRRTFLDRSFSTTASRESLVRVPRKNLGHRPSFRTFNPKVVRQFIDKLNGLQWPEHDSFRRFSTHSQHHSKKNECGGEEPELPCKKPSPPPIDCHTPIHEVKWPPCEKICMPCCRPAQMDECKNNFVKEKSCQKTPYRHPSFSECKRDALAKPKKKECCYPKPMEPQEYIGSAAKSPFTTVRQRTDKILGRDSSDHSKCFSTLSLAHSKKDMGCQPPAEKLPCKKPSPPSIPCKTPIYEIKWPKCEKICMPCCRPAINIDCTNNFIREKSCKKVPYRHPSFSECKRDHLTALKKKECCYQVIKCPEHSIDAASKSPFISVKERQDKILGRDPKSEC